MAKKFFNLLILDESGSMQSVKEQTITNYQEILQTIRTSQKKHKEQLQNVSLITFNSDGIKYVFDKMPIDEIKGFSQNDYNPDAMTPLWDAVGKSVNDLARFLINKRNYVVLVSILTDGFENASQEYKSNHIKKMVETYSKKNWIFTFIGAGDDVYKQAETVGIPSGNIWADSLDNISMKMKTRVCDSMLRLFANENIISLGTEPFDHFFDEETKPEPKKISDNKQSAAEDDVEEVTATGR